MRRLGLVAATGSCGAGVDDAGSGGSTVSGSSRGSSIVLITRAGLGRIESRGSASVERRAAARAAMRPRLLSGRDGRFRGARGKGILERRRELERRLEPVGRILGQRARERRAQRREIARRRSPSTRRPPGRRRRRSGAAHSSSCTSAARLKMSARRSQRRAGDPLGRGVRPTQRRRHADALERTRDAEARSCASRRRRSARRADAARRDRC